ncbi:MAG: FMNH2-dependent alkanesulfonate monooxygenase [Pseudomonadota bacterium]
MQRPFWYIPAHKDVRYLSSEIGARPATFEYLKQVAQAVDQLDYQGALVPTGTNCEDSWVIASSLAALTQQMKFIVAVRPGLMSPSAAARMSASFDRMTGGRLIVNVVGGGDPVELAGDGVFLSHSERYELMSDFLTVWKALVKGEECTFEGKFFKIDRGRLLFPCVQDPMPRLFMGASSKSSIQVAIDNIDTVLTWGEPPHQVDEKLSNLRNAAEMQGRELSFGIRLHIVVRESDEEAWAAADDLIRYVSDEAIEASQAVLARTESQGQKRMIALHGGRRDALEVSPNLWAGVGLVTGGAGTALVGSPKSVAARLLEYRDLGIETFILSGYPHLEEAYRVAELLFPELPIDPATETHRPVKPMAAQVIPGGW